MGEDMMIAVLPAEALEALAARVAAVAWGLADTKSSTFHSWANYLAALSGLGARVYGLYGLGFPD